MRPVAALPIPKSWHYTPTGARALGRCARCGKVAEFHDQIAFDEYLISGLCKPCQAIVFVEAEREYADTGER